MPPAQLVPAGAVLEWIGQQFGVATALVVVLGAGGLYFLHGYHARQTAVLADAHRLAVEQLREAQARYQEQIERLTGRFERALLDVEGRLSAGAREQAAVVRGLERTVDGLQVNVAALTALVGRVAGGRGSD